VITLPSASALAILRDEIAGRDAAPNRLAIFADPVFVPEDPRVVAHGAANPPTEGAATSGAATDKDQSRGVVKIEASAKQRLPFTRNEAESILALATDASMAALDFAASKRTALSPELGQYRIVHLATHGLLDSQHPELSGVVFSLVDEKGAPQDGFLRLHEIYNLRLNADLVVLSACQTALGREVRGEGLVGLTRGFMYAGAARVVASLWNVQDKATAELMKAFYEAMFRAGQTPAAALRTAQVAMWREGRAPYYWAAFVLQGEFN
jgi:CHAT domain-containing protein